MEKIIAIIFTVVAIYTLQYTKKIIFLLACNYILTLLMTWFGMDFGINMLFATVYPSDIICFILLFLMFALLLRGKNFNYGLYSYKYVKAPERKFFVLFAMFAVYSAGLGAVIYGMTSIYLGDIRRFAYFLVPVLFFSYYPIDLSSMRVKKTIKYTMNLLLIFCYLYWIIFFLTGYTFGSIEGSMRCISSDAAYVLAIYAIYLVYRDLIDGEKKILSIRTLLYIIAILIIQFNSAYMTFFSGLIVMIIFNWKKIIKVNTKGLVQLLFLCVAVLIIIKIFGSGDLLQSVSKTFAKFNQAVSGDAEGTIGGRYQIWKLVLSTLRGPIQWLSGQPMGTGYHVLYRGGIWEVSPHSGYIECLMKTGIVGIVLLIIPIIVLFVKGIKKRRVILSSFIIGTMFYWYPYTFTLEAGAIIGNIMWYMYNDSEVFK